ncbi:unnamed protein product [Victoria cruziana]
MPAAVVLLIVAATVDCQCCPQSALHVASLPTATLLPHCLPVRRRMLPSRPLWHPPAHSLATALPGCLLVCYCMLPMYLLLATWCCKPSMPKYFASPLVDALWLLYVRLC